MEFIQNSWVIGIGTSLISGALVYFATSFSLKRKKIVEYEKGVNEANMQIVSHLKPFVAEKDLPDYHVIINYIESKSREHNVKGESLFSIKEICQELVREVLENVYLSNTNKNEYTNFLKEYFDKYAETYDEAEEKKVIYNISAVDSNIKIITNEEYKKSNNRISTIFATLAGVITYLSIIYSFDVVSIRNESLINIFVITMGISVIIVFVIALFAYLIRKVKKYIDKRQQEKSNSNDKKI